MVSWLLSTVVCAASRTKNFSPAELEALVESAKRFAVIRSWYVRSNCILFPWVMFWGIHSQLYPFLMSDVFGNSQPIVSFSHDWCFWEFTANCILFPWVMFLGIHSQLYPFPMSDVLGNSQYVTFESAMSKHILLLRSISNPTKCNWECARLYNQLWSPKMICIAACTCWKGNDVQQQEIKRCWYSLYSWSFFLFC